jgi:hypothetical protein
VWVILKLQAVLLVNSLGLVMPDETPRLVAKKHFLDPISKKNIREPRHMRKSVGRVASTFLLLGAGGDAGGNHPTGHCEAHGPLRDCPAESDDDVDELVPKPARGPGPARDLQGGLEERQPVALRFFAVAAVLGPEHVHRPGDRNVAEPWEAARLPPGSDDTAARTARQLVSLDDNLPPAGSDGGGNDSIVGQIEEDGGSVGCVPGRLVVLFQVECLESQRPRRSVRTENVKGCCIPCWSRKRTARMMRLSVVVEADVSMVPNFGPLLSVARRTPREPWTVATSTSIRFQICHPVLPITGTAITSRQCGRNNIMDIIHDRAVGIDISKRDAKVCVRLPSARKGQFSSTVSTWASTADAILDLRNFLERQDVTIVAMEATGDYWKPFYYVLEDTLPVLLVNAKNARNIPG